MKTWFRASMCFALLCLAALTTGCGDGSTEPDPGPLLRHFSMSPASIDLEAAGGSATVLVQVRTLADTIFAVEIGLLGPQGQERSCFFADFVETTGGEDVWTCSFTFVTGVEDGDWRPFVTLFGSTEPTVDAEQLGQAGYVNRLTITGGGGTDVTPPVLTDVTVLTPNIAPGEGFNYEVTATDESTGLATAAVFLQNSTGMVFVNSVCWSHELSAGTTASGTFTCSGLDAAPLPAGTYTVHSVLIGDRAGILSQYTASDLAGMGITDTDLVID